MPGNTFGQLYRITTFGESHGGAVGVVIDGCPPNIEISEEEIQKDLRPEKTWSKRNNNTPKRTGCYSYPLRHG